MNTKLLKSSLVIMKKYINTFAREMSATTVYSEKVEQPMKCAIVCPLHVKRDVPSGIKPLPWVSRILLHKFVFGDLQNLQSPH